MSFFVRYFFPFSYFQATRLTRWALVAYNGLVEWLPALALSFYYNNYSYSAVGRVFLSYLAFICVYEIGYLTNDFFSERFEKDPRGRAEQINVGSSIVYLLIAVRLLFFVLFSYLLGALANPLWLTFHAMMLGTFALHNTLPKELRIPTFFGLSSYRFFAPLIVCLDVQILFILLPTVLLINSLYRTIVYGSSKGIFVIENRSSFKFKVAFYLTCLPFCIFLSVFFQSFLPVGFCLYFILVWVIYSRFSRDAD